MTPIVRFAPSPTGLLHIGNARTALINWLFTKHHKGRMILRLDDTDKIRSTQEFEDAIKADLIWLGLEWQEFKRQSDRIALYDTAFKKLQAAGRVYPCFETLKDLEYKRKRQLRAGKPPVYDRSALNLTDQQLSEYHKQGLTPHWRFKLNDEKIEFNDLVRGQTNFHGARLSDPVLMRGDGTYLYMLPSTVDDMDLKITHIIRGEDHVSNSAIQLQLFQALEGNTPQLAHLPLLSNVDGEGFSKRLGSLSLTDLRNAGIEPMAINSMLAYLGTSVNINIESSLTSLVKKFDIALFSRSTPKFDCNHLKTLNVQFLRELPYKAVAKRLKKVISANNCEKFWMAVRENIEKFSDCRLWHQVCYSDIEIIISEDDIPFLQTASNVLPQEPWDNHTWEHWISSIKKISDRKGKGLFLPIRLALTGLDYGPELKNLLPLMGRKLTLSRLNSVHK